MKKFKQYSNIALFSALFMMTFIMGGCGGSSSCDETGRPANPDITSLTVISTIPASNQTDVQLEQIISATLSDELNLDTIDETTFTLYDNGTIVAGAVAHDGNRTIYFDPTDPLNINTVYTATITTGVEGLTGNTLASDYVWSFTTVPEVFPTNLTVISTIPYPDETRVPHSITISALLNEELVSGTVSNATFTLFDTNLSLPVDGNVAYDDNRSMSFDPLVPLKAATIYTATITTGVEGLTGNTLASDYVWSFRTGNILSENPASVDLGTAGNFVILAETKITTTGTTAIVGDIGIYPNPLSDITGFSQAYTTGDQFATSALVDGYIYAADMGVPTPENLNTAVIDMVAAYGDAAGRITPAPTTLVTNNLSGLTLPAGIYTTASDVLIDSDATVTLFGGANDVWIFQIGTSLTLGDSSAVVLKGGAQAKNVFWQVGSNAAIGAYANFKGVILSYTDIAVLTGATVEGRLLSQTAVTLQSNQVTAP